MPFARAVRAAGWVVGVFGLLGAVGGCTQQPYLSDYNYEPKPAIAQVIKRGSEQSPPVTALATVIGVRRADSEHHTGPAVVVRLRFENNGPAEAEFDPSTLDLVTGMLRSFPPPVVSPPGVLRLSAGQRQEVTASFPFPPGTGPSQMDLSNLRLRWMVRVDNYPVPQTALFERLGDGYAPPPPADAGTNEGNMVY